MKDLLEHFFNKGFECAIDSYYGHPHQDFEACFKDVIIDMEELE